jgi:HAD superfamily phosphatase (TIGR01668 family)
VSLLRPDRSFRSLLDIDSRSLKDLGIEALLVDIDNTIVPWRGEHPDEAIVRRLTDFQEAGILIILVSNAGAARAERMAEKLGCRAVAPAKKPFSSGYRRAHALLGIAKNNIATVGDQIFTDVLGGNRYGIKTILVDPLSRKEFAGTRIVRILERRYRKVKF